MISWLDTYREKYQPLLDLHCSGEKRGLKSTIYNRAQGYGLIFKLLLDKKQNNFKIIETGTVRNPMNWKDGNSGYLFTEFVKQHQGSVRSVDIDPEAVERAQGYVDSSYYLVTCSDSVAWLEQQTDLHEVDLFYLDSWDVKWHNDEASAQHHLREFQVIEKFIQPGTVVAIDDNARLLDNRRTGKGRAIVEYLEHKSVFPIYDDYQIIYKF